MVDLQRRVLDSELLVSSSDDMSVGEFLKAQLCTRVGHAIVPK